MTNQEDFISTVSHELRTPLTSIRGFAQTMLTSWDRLDDAAKKKFLTIIEQQSNRLINLVENILSVTKLPNESLILKNINVNSSILPVIQIVNEQYKNHVIETKFDKSNPTISVDLDKFQQIMINLIENAAKYSDDGTTITIITLHTDKYVIIKVQDEGIGISDEFKEKIFEKFSRIDNPLTRKIQGSGLGLYITKTLVEKMNGEISFHNIEKGVEFEVKFPVYSIEEHVKCSVTQL
ncbi:MAG: sensor histidine kinase [Candidatus Gastranaerophilaceae bacterium]